MAPERDHLVLMPGQPRGWESAPGPLPPSTQELLEAQEKSSPFAMRIVMELHANRGGEKAKWSKSHTKTITNYRKIIIYGHKPTDDCNLIFQNKIKNERNYVGTT